MLNTSMQCHVELQLVRFSKSARAFTTRERTQVRVLGVRFSVSL